MKFRKFEDIEPWQKARLLSKKVYSSTKNEEFKKDYGLKDQVQRASVSIMANIAEGFDSSTDKSFAIFLNYAYRSATEVQPLLYVAFDQSYITNNNFDKLYALCQDVKNLIGGLIKYLNKSK